MGDMPFPPSSGSRKSCARDSSIPGGKAHFGGGRDCSKSGGRRMNGTRGRNTSPVEIGSKPLIRFATSRLLSWGSWG
eukprot:CAMPEP_0194384170 /NCGR_PEP_ID=MMETSP0174-20130528/72399_1 /TAXON_ID=216777 /ORGANISM="Proboscia alata, Strain PI-D3" /LENGTH=76 /DNA_ID=CAMNT_0039171119 /DNA_START=102 /DNA_END=329 /DNA_ORIENTATION=+